MYGRCGRGRGLCYGRVRWGGGATWAHSRIARPGGWGVGHCGPMLASADEGGNGGCEVRGQLTLEKSGEEEVGGGGDLPRDAVAERVFRALLRRVIILLNDLSVREFWAVMLSC